jgi:hypothetical protein
MLDDIPFDDLGPPGEGGSRGDHHEANPKLNQEVSRNRGSSSRGSQSRTSRHLVNLPLSLQTGAGGRAQDYQARTEAAARHARSNSRTSHGVGGGSWAVGAAPPRFWRARSGGADG